MKILYKYMAFAAIFAMLITSCSKDETAARVDDPAVQSVDLSFGAVLNDLANRAAEVNKNHFSQLPDCSEATPAFAVIGFSYGGEDYETTVAILSDGTDYFTDYSEDLKIPVPNNSSVEVTLSSFMVYDGDPDGDGELIWVAPIELENGQFDGYVDEALPFSFDVSDGTKPYIPVEVLCFDDRMANEYGYVFFDILPEIIYPLCLFVNYCDEDGRHFVADYSVDLYFGTDDTGIQLYDYLEDASAMATTGDYGDGEYYAEPLCLIVPGPPANLPANQPYLYLVVYPQDWAGTGDIDNSPIGNIQLTWNMVNGLLNNDGETNEYWHLLIGECDGALTGDGSGGGNGDNDLDDDGVPNNEDLCPNTPDGASVNAVGCPDSDGDGVFDNDDDCPDEVPVTDEDGDGCEDTEPCANSGGDSDLDGICDDDENEGCINDPDTNCGETGGGDPEFTCDFVKEFEDCALVEFDQSEATPDEFGLYPIMINGVNEPVAAFSISTDAEGDVNISYQTFPPYEIDDLGIILDNGFEDCSNENLIGTENADAGNLEYQGNFGNQTNVQILMHICAI